MKVSGVEFLSGTAGAFETSRTNNVVSKNGNAFEKFFNSYMSMIDETNVQQNYAEQMNLDYALGKTDDTLAVALAQKQAQTSLSFTVQVTNKLIEAYREIMRLQI